MKVLVVTNNIRPNSGWGRYSGAIIRLLPEQGIEYRLLTEDSIDQGSEQLATLLPSNSIINILLNLFKVRKLARDFEIVHAFDGWPYGFYAYAAVWGTKKKMFINAVGTYTVAPLRQKIKKFFLQTAYRRANKIFCISDYVKNSLASILKLDNLVTVYLGTTALPELSAEEIVDFKKQYGIHDQYPILLTVGEIKERKGQLDTLQAAKLLKKQFPNFLYIMVGSEKFIDFVQSIRDYIKDNDLSANVKIISDAKGDKNLAFFYQICQIFLLNSNNYGDNFEGFGLVLLEAAQFGKPVIGSKDCGTEEALRDGYNGYATEQKNHQQIYEKIIKILGPDYERLAKNSIDWQKHFIWKKTVQTYVKYYQQ